MYVINRDSQQLLSSLIFCPYYQIVNNTSDSKKYINWKYFVDEETKF